MPSIDQFAHIYLRYLRMVLQPRKDDLAVLLRRCPATAELHDAVPSVNDLSTETQPMDFDHFDEAIAQLVAIGSRERRCLEGNWKTKLAELAKPQFFTESLSHWTSIDRPMVCGLDSCQMSSVKVMQSSDVG